MSASPRLLDRLLRRGPVSAPLQSPKLRVIDAIFERGDVASIADLGGVWAVDGGYTFHAIESHHPERAVLVDERVEAIRGRADVTPSLEAVQGNFGDTAIAERVGSVDAVLFFDVLLHQVKPNWDEVLALYAQRARYVGVVQPQYVLGDETVRLLELGRERYLELVPDLPAHHEVWERMDDFVPHRGRVYRDIHDIWQWGITDGDLRRRAESLGFELVYFENAGTWQDRRAFETHAFIFRRPS